ncbi:DUF4328 domain-containing protein [Streptomyces sp. AV19]|nr:DUF4328 domain-containing protein [Streptomyces sp. AV19]
MSAYATPPVPPVPPVPPAQNQPHPAPPAYAPPRQYTPAPRLASPQGLSRAVVVLLGVCALTDVFSLFAGATMFGVSTDVIDNGVDSVAQSDLDRSDLLQAAAGFLQTLALLATAVVFVVWFHRVRTNAEVFRPDGHRMRRGWTIWGWITPVVNLWFPKKLADDVWAASLPYEPDGSLRRASRAVMGWWWGLWLATLALGRAGGRMYFKAETFEEIRTATGVLLVADVVDIVAAVVAALFVLRLTALQNEKAYQGPMIPFPASPVM